MCEKIKKFWEDLDVATVVSKRELVLGVTACTLMGMVVGMLVSPRKNITAGCNNGSNNTVDHRSADESDGDDENDEDDEDDEDVVKF